jgi:hypothetical protein
MKQAQGIACKHCVLLTAHFVTSVKFRHHRFGMEIITFWVLSYSFYKHGLLNS